MITTPRKQFGNKNVERPPIKNPERTMWADVLKTAWKDYYSSNKLNKDDAIEWFEDESMEPGGYGWICELLDLDPGTLYKVIQIRPFKKTKARNQYTHKKWVI